jgi:hypothetical protein
LKDKIPYFHPIDTFHKNPDSFGNGDYPSPFEWTKPKWLKGDPEKLLDPRPLRTRYYYKYLSSVNGKPRWFPVWEECLTKEDGLGLLGKALATLVEYSDANEFRYLRESLRRAKITEYEI